MKEIDLYTKAHLVVAAIRILERQANVSSSIEKVCQMISFSLEHGNLICKKLDEMGIIEIVKGAYGTRLFIKNHLKIEEIPTGAGDDRADCWYDIAAPVGGGVEGGRKQGGGRDQQGFSAGRKPGVEIGSGLAAGRTK